MLTSLDVMRTSRVAGGLRLMSGTGIEAGAAHSLSARSSTFCSMFADDIDPDLPLFANLDERKDVAGGCDERNSHSVVTSAGAVQCAQQHRSKHRDRCMSECIDVGLPAFAKSFLHLNDGRVGGRDMRIECHKSKWAGLGRRLFENAGQSGCCLPQMIELVVVNLLH